MSWWGGRCGGYGGGWSGSCGGSWGGGGWSGSYGSSWSGGWGGSGGRCRGGGSDWAASAPSIDCFSGSSRCRTRGGIYSGFGGGSGFHVDPIFSSAFGESGFDPHNPWASFPSVLLYSVDGAQALSRAIGASPFTRAAVDFLNGAHAITGNPLFRRAALQLEHSGPVVGLVALTHSAALAGTLYRGNPPAEVRGLFAHAASEMTGRPLPETLWRFSPTGRQGLAPASTAWDATQAATLLTDPARYVQGEIAHIVDNVIGDGPLHNENHIMSASRANLEGRTVDALRFGVGIPGNIGDLDTGAKDH